MRLRNLTATDYDAIIVVLNDWWAGREMRNKLPKLFAEHFCDTSFVIETQKHVLTGFLVGFLSQSQSDEAYIHFVGVDPDYRGSGIGRRLYERFFDEVRQRGRRVVTCVTSPVNKTSIAFHRRMGFTPAPSPTATEEGVPYVADYDGPGEPRVVFSKAL